jgi:hypothetical protein
MIPIIKRLPCFVVSYLSGGQWVGEASAPLFEGRLKSPLPHPVTPQSRVRLDRDGLPSETLKSGSSERGESAGGAEGAVLRVSAPWLIAQMFRFKFSPERPPRSWA